MATLLILSDDKDTTALFQLVLEREGYKCVTTISVQDFISQLQSSNFDMFLLVLPLDSQPDGWVLYKDLKTDSAYNYIPVIVYTALYQASFPNPKDYGVVVLNGNHVYSFIEKPTGSIPTNLINAGLYIFEPDVIGITPQGFGRLEQDVFPKLAQKEELAGYVFYGAWQDVRSSEGLEQATKAWEQQQNF